MESNEIKIAVIKADSEKVDEEKLKTESYVDARFDHIVENFANADESKTKIGKEIVESRETKTDSDPEYVSPEQKRLDNMEAEKKASLEPIGGTKE